MAKTSRNPARDKRPASYLFGAAALFVAVLAAFALSSARLSQHGSSAFRMQHAHLVGERKLIPVVSSPHEHGCCANAVEVIYDPEGIVIAAAADNLFCKLDDLVDQATIMPESSWTHKPHGSVGYPGDLLRLDGGSDSVVQFERCILPVISAAFGDEAVRSIAGSGHRPSTQDYYFGVIHFPASVLRRYQKLPHTDTSETSTPRRSAGFGVVVGLFPDRSPFEDSGIALYRQVGTNISKVADRIADEALKQHYDAQLGPNWKGALDAAFPGYYAAPGNELAEELAVAYLRQNRAVMYDFTLQHNAYIPPDVVPHLTAHPSAGRLTLNGFFSADEAEVCKARAASGCVACRTTFGCAWCGGTPIPRCVPDNDEAQAACTRALPPRRAQQVVIHDASRPCSHV